MAALASAAVALASFAPPARDACPAPRFTVTPVPAAAVSAFTGGVSLVDVDGDGDLDVHIAGGYDVSGETKPYRPEPSVLYLNDGSGRFTAAVSAIGQERVFASGSSWADIDADGDLDGFVAVELGQPDLFYRNLGAGRLARQPLGEATEAKAGTFAAAWVDTDGDGDLDLFVTGPTLEPPGPNLVFENRAGVFVRRQGLAIENGKSNPGAGIWGDLDGDGDPDLVVTNSDIGGRDFPAERRATVVYRNLGGWRFAAEPGPFTRDDLPANAAALGDIDSDGDLDLFIGAAHGRDALFRNDGAGRFVEVPLPSRPHAELSGGAAFADLDGDGDLDLLVAPYNEAIELLLNDGTGRFAHADAAGLAASASPHASLAVGDLDGDGDLDAVAGAWSDQHAGRPPLLLRNETPPCGRPVKVSLIARNGVRDPVGARVTLRTPDGRRALREVSAQTGFRSQSADQLRWWRRGPISGAFEVRWPDGQRQTVRLSPGRSAYVVRPPIA